MKIMDFISSLLPSFGKNRVLEDIRITRNELNEITHPAYKTAVNVFKGWKFKSEKVLAYFKVFDTFVKHPSNENYVMVVECSIADIVHNLTHVEDIINKTFNEDVGAGGLTYQKANLLQFVEACAFVSKYARKFLNFIYICETEQYEEAKTSLSVSLSVAELKWLDEQLIPFANAFAIITKKQTDIEKLIDLVPDIEITNDNAKTLESTIGITKLDPFNFGLVAGFMHPVYHFRMMIAEWQADRYKEAKEEMRLLSLRKLNLEKLADGKPDANTQKEIQYLETRVQDLTYKIAQMEEKYGK